MTGNQIFLDLEDIVSYLEEKQKPCSREILHLRMLVKSDLTKDVSGTRTTTLLRRIDRLGYLTNFEPRGGTEDAQQDPRGS
jgi:hypothetical protein